MALRNKGIYFQPHYESEMISWGCAEQAAGQVPGRYFQTSILRRAKIIVWQDGIVISGILGGPLGACYVSYCANKMSTRIKCQECRGPLLNGYIHIEHIGLCVLGRII